MDYEKRYKEAIEAMKDCIPDKDGYVCVRPCDIFSELQESKDEKIRKELVEYFRWNAQILNDFDNREVIAWLEKQVKETAISQHENKTCKENDDSLTCEDDRIRKWLLDFVQGLPDEGLDFHFYNLNKEQVIAWLEKQNHDGKKWIYEDVYLKEKEQLIQDGIDEVLENPQKYGLEKQAPKPPGKTALEAIHDEKVGNANKVEPKFHKDDWVVCEVTGTVYQIKNCIENLSNHKYGYDLTNGGYIGSDEVNHYHLWTIADTREGDVLTASDGSLFIFAKVKDNSAYYHFSLCKNGSKEISDGNHAWETATGCLPATKEQIDILFKEMYEAGYEWNAKAKKLEAFPILSNSSKTGKKWTEEDECYMGECISAIATKDSWSFEEKRKTKHWLESIKQKLKQ